MKEKSPSRIEFERRPAINSALIGCGRWGTILERYIKKDRDFNLEYVCNSKSDLDKVWNDERIDAVIVATPNETHYPIVKSALLHGKHVLSEKPLTFEATQGEELKEMGRSPPS